MKTKPNWIALGLLAAAVAAVLAAKVVRREGRGASVVRVESPSAASSFTVLLVADPDEAESLCGCGKIIRLVRTAGRHGIAVREIAPDSGDPLLRRHRVTVMPTVLFLDPAGQAIQRFEGESPEVVDAIRRGFDGRAKGAA